MAHRQKTVLQPIAPGVANRDAFAYVSALELINHKAYGIAQCRSI
jgi:hypothetical protein